MTLAQDNFIALAASVGLIAKFEYPLNPKKANLYSLPEMARIATYDITNGRIYLAGVKFGLTYVVPTTPQSGTVLMPKSMIDPNTVYTNPYKIYEDVNGNTILPIPGDARIVYVSDSTGNDSNDGLSSGSPKKTLSAGHSLLRDGYPDRLLLKRGDTFLGQVFDWYKKGRGVTEPMVIGAYGTGARPILDNNNVNSAIISMIGNGVSPPNADYLALLNLDFYNSKRDPNSGNYDSGANATSGIFWLGGFNSFLIEGCRFRFFKDNITLQEDSRTPQTLNNLVMRRNQILDAYSAGSGHSQGMYCSKPQSGLLEQNFWDHNGWNASVVGADLTVFNHNIYIFEPKNLIIRNEISVRSRDGIKISSDHALAASKILIEDVALIDNDYGIGLDQSALIPVYGHSDVLIRNSLVDYVSSTISPDAHWAVWLRSGEYVKVYGNLWLHKTASNSQPVFNFEDTGSQQVTIYDNLIYQYTVTGGAPVIDQPAAGPNTNNITIAPNLIEPVVVDNTKTVMAFAGDTRPNFYTSLRDGYIEAKSAKNMIAFMKTGYRI